LSWWTKGQSGYTFVVPDGPDTRRRVFQASRLLQAALREATGARLPVIREADHKPGAPAIYLGMTRAARHARLPLKRIRGWTCLRQVNGKDIFLVGPDDTAGIKGAPYREYFGTLKAVTSFLEDEVGARFLLPGPNGTYVPKLKRLSVSADMRVLTKPNFVYVIGRSAGDLTYSIANNYLYTAPIVESYGGHSYYSAVPAAKYGKTHPEYFALLGGVRTASGNHLCISNPDVRKLMIEEMEKQLDKGYQWVALGQTDGYQPCQCARCRAIDPNSSERVWIVHRKLAEEMKRLRPGKKIQIISYGPTIHPPTSFKTFPDNVVIEMCHYDPKSFDEWRPYNVDKTVYIYNWGTYWVMGFGPKRTPRYAADQIRMFLKNRVRGIYMCGAFEDPGLEGPVFYVYGKMMGDPSLDPTTLADDFYRAAYGKARTPMKAFFTAMYDRLEFYSAINRPNFRTDRPAMRTFNTPEDAYCHFFPAELLIKMERDLERAQAVATDPKVRARIRLVGMEFAYVKDLATIFQLYRAYRLNPDWGTFNTLAAAIRQRNTMIDSWYDKKGRFKRFDGWPRLWGGASRDQLKAGGSLHGVLSAPVNWNTRLLMSLLHESESPTQKRL